MVAARRRAQFGLIAAGVVLALAMYVVVRGAHEAPTIYTGKVGSPAVPFRLPDTNGKLVSLESMRGSVVVLCFVPTPTSEAAKNEEIERLRQLSERYDTQADVKLVAVYTDADLQVFGGSDASRTPDAGPGCLTLVDPTSAIAHRYQIEQRPTFLVIDANGRIRYRGDIDNTSPEAPLASVSFPTLIDLLLAERPLPASPTAAVLSNIK